MLKTEEIFRPCILELTPYSSARKEYTGSRGIFLDANENPFGKLNRYPDPLQGKLKNKISTLRKIKADSIFIGNGSDEVIDLLFRICCEPGTDRALTISPSYGMYDVAAATNNTTLIKVPLKKDFSIDSSRIKDILSNDPSVKLFILCSPNNPTGNSFNKDTIKYLTEGFKGLVLIDEAYIDYSSNESMINEIASSPNLVVAQTFSKAYGLAGARIGMAFSSHEIISVMNNVKPPYNVSSLNQAAALKTLRKRKRITKRIEKINSEKRRVEQSLKDMSIVRKLYPSDANFLLVEFEKSDIVFSTLKEYGIITRDRSKQVPRCLRITIGKPTENTRMLKILKRIKL